ncbi:MAG: hypothetical protein BWK72_07400 [Rhodoferax ferrireducens]|uniref:Polysaccharide pyruvyl transferase domain-containing protein n=2 Tax=Pseudomonadota TaxID=1224 RepID=A0A1Y1R0H6_9GAMM|nr:MAG: hypothetical protein BWK72_07400 [Rhodoferax ferrireducens]OQX17325.1 MAG: hypothetical protein BWK73_01170 [Thiothrix lacustris]
MEIVLKEFLHQFRGQPLVYTPNPGNGGDALIAAGTYQLFDELGLDFQIVNRDLPNYDGQVLIYGGGGNLGLMKNFSARMLSRVHQGVKRLVILPHTIKAVTPLLSEFGANVDVICRERISYEYVKGSVRQANVYLADDMALSLKVAPLLSLSHSWLDKLSVGAEYSLSKGKLSGAQAPSLSSVRKLFIAERLVQGMRDAAKGDVLNAFRTDSEKTDIKLPPDNVDVSEVLTLGVETRRLAYLASHYFLSFLNHYRVINTNRLHVCIGGVLLGKQVNFYPNSYYKCRAVYDYSLKDRPSVVLHE